MFVIAGLDPAIHPFENDGCAGIGGAEATPSFGRLCPHMTGLCVEEWSKQ
jgi:hypothetical protein